MARVYFFVPILLFVNVIFSQKVVVDSILKEPIPFVEIYSQEGKIMGVTNNKGEVSEEQMVEMKKVNVQKLTLRHGAYQNKNRYLQELKKTDTVYLFQPDIPIVLDEVTLTKKIKAPKYLKFTAYYRSFQFSNSQLQYFMDGIAEYYIKTKNKKVRAKIVQNRSYSDKSIKQIDEKGGIRVSHNMVGIPDIDHYIDFDNLSDEYFIDESDNNSRLYKDGREVGKLNIRNENALLDIQMYSKENPRVMKGFGIQATLNDYRISAMYEINRKVRQGDIQYFKEYRHYLFKKKRKTKYAHIFDVVNEVYIIDKEFTNNANKAKSNNYYMFMEKSNYRDNFWEALDSKYIPPMPDSVESFTNKAFLR